MTTIYGVHYDNCQSFETCAGYLGFYTTKIEAQNEIDFQRENESRFQELEEDIRGYAYKYEYTIVEISLLDKFTPPCPMCLNNPCLKDATCPQEDEEDF